MTEGTLRMSIREHLRAEVCQQLLAKKISEQAAAKRLGVSTRQVRRLKKRLAQEGAAGIIHRLRGRPANRKTDADIQTQVGNLYRETYRGWNLAHFSEWLKAKHGIDLSRETVRQILLNEPERPRRKPRDPHRRWRERRAQEGELVQLDTSIHPWLGKGGEKSVLISAIDDATSKVLWSEFFARDGTLENLSVIEKIVRKHGIFASLYLDRAGKFFLADEAYTRAIERGESGLTQFGRVMEVLGIETIKARSPQAKGRIERSFNTFQDRLVKELALMGITRREEANRYLQEVYLPHHNANFSVSAADSGLGYVRVVEELDYASVFCLRETRVIRNDYTISLGGVCWQLSGQGLRAREQVEIRTWLDGSVHVYFGGAEVSAERIYRRTG